MKKPIRIEFAKIGVDYIKLTVDSICGCACCNSVANSI